MAHLSPAQTGPTKHASDIPTTSSGRRSMTLLHAPFDTKRLSSMSRRSIAGPVGSLTRRGKHAFTPVAMASTSPKSGACVGISVGGGRLQSKKSTITGSMLRDIGPMRDGWGGYKAGEGTVWGERDGRLTETKQCRI